LRILSLSTFGRACGIADYNSDLATAVREQGDVFDIVPIDPPLIASRSRAQVAAKFESEFISRLKDYDAGVIQHEMSFFGSRLWQSYLVFGDLLRSVRRSGKPVFIYFHTRFPTVHLGKSVRGIGGFFILKMLIWRIAREIKKSRNIRAVVHGSVAKDHFVKLGVPPEKISDVLFPAARMSSAAAPYVPKPDGPITLLIFGFVAQYKGYETALTAMRFLPDNVRLVIAGDRHPLNAGDRTLDAIYGYLETGRWIGHSVLGWGLDRPSDIGFDTLKSRVEVTGYIPSGDLERIISSADIILAPYTDQGPAGSSALSWAFAAGKPIIASSVTAFAEIYEKTKAVKLVAPNSPFELAAAVRRLVEAPEEMKLLADAASNFATMHNWASMAADLKAMVTRG